MGEYDWAIGVAFSFASSILSCLGLIFQKYAHMQNERLPDDKKYPVMLGIVCSPCWWASFLMMGAFPFPFDFFAYSFAPQSLVAPFAGLTLVMNQFFAPLILKEKLYRIDIYASIVVFAGCTITTVTGNHEEQTYTLDMLMENFKNVTFIVGVTLLGLFMVAMMYSLVHTDPLRNMKTWSKSSTMRQETVEEAAETGSSPTTSTRATTEDITTTSNNNNDVEIDNIDSNNTSSHQISFAPSSDNVQPTTEANLPRLEQRYRAMHKEPKTCGFGALQNIFFKAVGVLMKNSVFDDGGTDDWLSPAPYFFIILVIVFAVTQLSYLNKGMARFNAVLVFPLYNACYLSLSVIMGALYYNEFASFDQTQWILFPLGVIITLLGVIMFIFKPNEEEPLNQDQSQSGSEQSQDEDPVPIHHDNVYVVAEPGVQEMKKPSVLATV